MPQANIKKNKHSPQCRKFFGEFLFQIDDEAAVKDAKVENEIEQKKLTVSTYKNIQAVPSARLPAMHEPNMQQSSQVNPQASEMGDYFYRNKVFDRNYSVFCVLIVFIRIRTSTRSRMCVTSYRFMGRMRLHLCQNL